MYDGLADFGLGKESARTVDIATVCKNLVHLLAKRMICHGHAVIDVHSSTITVV
jgi:5,10-methylene-tetrahydrofolate dehydrogenase/methenyl tetrahydrofolate cyclohydrolase